eukprot:jgi/Psemu1/8849/gm1.8849_g
MDRLRYTSPDGRQLFFVPFLNPYGGELDFIDEHTPEKHSMLAALSQTGVYRNLDDNTTPTHRLKGKRPNNTLEFDKSALLKTLLTSLMSLMNLASHSQQGSCELQPVLD